MEKIFLFSCRFMIAVPTFDPGEKLRLTIGGQKGLLNLFSPGVQPAVTNKEFAKITDRFDRCIKPADHLEVLSHHAGLLGEAWGRRRRFALHHGMKALIYPGIPNGASCDEDTVELGGFKTLDGFLRLKEIAASNERGFREVLFYLCKKGPIDLADEFLYDGARVDDQGIDVLL